MTHFWTVHQHAFIVKIKLDLLLIIASEAVHMKTLFHANVRVLYHFFFFFNFLKTGVRVEISGLEYKLQHFRLFSVDPYGRKYSWNDAEKDGEKKLFSYVFTSPQSRPPQQSRLHQRPRLDQVKMQSSPTPSSTRLLDLTNWSQNQLV